MQRKCADILVAMNEMSAVELEALVVATGARRQRTMAAIKQAVTASERGRIVLVNDNGRKINAIKVHRYFSRAGLKESKDVIDGGPGTVLHTDVSPDEARSMIDAYAAEQISVELRT